MSQRDEFEKWFARYHDEACAQYGGIDCTNPKGIAEDAWQASRAAALEEAAMRIEPRNAPDDWTDYAKVRAQAASDIRPLARAEGA